MRAGASTLAVLTAGPTAGSELVGGPGSELSLLGPSAVSDDDDAMAASTRKGANMTERVPVPSSEHVAEIVGRQGCKIKALRNKTNTYIKTPVRGEEPVFVVTGRQQDVDSARREILSAAEHFTQIRASRRHHPSKVPATTSAPRRRSPSPTQGSRRPTRGGQAGSGAPTTTLGVRVPMSMVGLVVGPKGATIKRIQADTGTYIVTPGRDRDPVFEVIGSPEAVERARQHIDAYIETRLAATAVDSQAAGSGSGDGWSGDPDGLTTGRFDLAVDSHDAVSRLLALNADYTRPPPQTPLWPATPSTPMPWSSWSSGGQADDDTRLSSLCRLYSSPLSYNPSPSSSHSLSITTDTDELISALYARMLIAADTSASAASTDQLFPGDQAVLSPTQTASFGLGGPAAAFQTDLGVLSTLYHDGNEDWGNVDFGGNDGGEFVDDGPTAAAAAGRPPWGLRPEVGVTSPLGGGVAARCGSDGATSPSCSPAESSTGSAAS